MKLGTLLLRNAAISLTQLEAGLRAQVLYGGRLGTNLVELGFLDVDGLGGFLGELSGLPIASQGLLEMAQSTARRAAAATPVSCGARASSRPAWPIRPAMRS